ncbi:hypothetical protein C5167_024725 [Papaver somniferum]|uniref:Protein kinase domain-containing protein n=1 Tax=Papaver somniferum TaxID=3469 RepID=A0A4Y7JT49_PAPSO|nr:hypothetical protein C5167_024725 [Papaver somniferum]
MRRIPNLAYMDLSSNQLNGSIPSSTLSDNMATMYVHLSSLVLPIASTYFHVASDLSNNQLEGNIPDSFSGLLRLQRLSLENNFLNGSTPCTIWNNRIFNATENLILNFQNNSLSDISSTRIPPVNVTIRLLGNPVCMNANQLNIVQFCGPPTEDKDISDQPIKTVCGECPKDYEGVTADDLDCFCAAPLKVEYRLKSPGFSDFRPYEAAFNVDLSSSLSLELDQISVVSFAWEKGPRLMMHLNLFPNRVNIFNQSEIQRIRSLFTGWKIRHRDIFGPYELKKFNLGFYADGGLESQSSGLSKSVFAGIILGVIAVAVTLTALVSIFIARRRMKDNHRAVSRKPSKRIPIKADGVKGFTFEEMALATYNFDSSTQVGQGGYGKVYKGVLSDGSFVASKRAQEGSFQGDKEFFNEIELLSRVHHRNLVFLIGYCDEENVKSSNILICPRFSGKVADFGLSPLAPVPDLEGTTPEHVSTIVKGTPGYLDPEYFLTHQLTDKSDVYSLGVVFLEILTGKLPIQNDARPSMAQVVKELEDILYMMSDSDISIAVSTDHGIDDSEVSITTTTTPPSPSSVSMYNRDWDLYVSSEYISGSDLVSGLIPTIAPR